MPPAQQTELAASANGQFGSGWAWLVQDNAGKLSVVKTSNAETPITDGLKPLLVIDVWVRACVPALFALRVALGRPSIVLTLPDPFHHVPIHPTGARILLGLPKP
jgi:hypothetical protein